MQTKAYFENIQSVILDELSNAKKSIKIAIAWFTDDDIFNMLCKRAENGITIELLVMNDRINKRSAIDYKRLDKLGSKVWLVENANPRKSIMHNKFCIIDYSTIISGSYNWTKQAKKNNESITVIKENTKLALDFEQEFEHLINTLVNKEEEIVPNTELIGLRLETLKNTILLEDLDDINYQLEKLRKQSSTIVRKGIKHTLTNIIGAIENQSYREGIKLIDEFTRQFKSLIVFVDPEIQAIKLEIKALELQISSLEDEYSFMEKMIYAFQTEYDKQLGKILLEILELRENRYKREKEVDPEKEEEYIDSKQEFENFKQNYETRIQDEIITLSEEDKIKIDQIFRKASKMCHPDIVSESQKDEATKIFIELKKAFEKNDIKKVEEIYQNLKKGIFVTVGENVTEKNKLLSIVLDLRTKRNNLEEKLEELRNDETYLKINQIKDWSEYFKIKKIKLEKILDEEINLIKK